MSLYRYYPVPGDRMGFLWCATQIQGLAILEFGPMGTTNFATRHMGESALIYSTHISDHILTFGQSKDLRAAVKELDATGRFQAIVVALSSSTAITGFDMESFCMEMQEEVSARLIPLDYSSLGIDYSVGMEKGMKLLMQEFAEPCALQQGSYNLLGCCDDEYLIDNDAKAIGSVLSQTLNLHCRMTYPCKTSLAEIRKVPEAQFNLVLRQEALPTAQWLEQQFGTPYLLADGYGDAGMQQLLSGAAELSGRILSAPHKPSMELLASEIRRQPVLILGSRGSADALERTLRQDFFMENVRTMCFSKAAEKPFAYSEKHLIDWMQNWRPTVLLGNSALFDFPGRAEAIEIPVLKPVGIVGKTPRISQPLRTYEGLAALHQMLTGQLCGNSPATGAYR